MGRVSMPQGKGSQLHNRREYEKIGKPIPDNIDVSKSSENITLVDKDIKQAYQEIFGEALEKYNAKQKRADRKIEDYCDHIKKSKNGEKLFYEDVVQWGSKEDFQKPEMRERAKDKQIADLQTENASLRGQIRSLTAQMDEIKAELWDKINNLRDKLRGAYESLTNVVKAVGMLKYDREKDQNGNYTYGKYGISNLSKAQEKLIDGLAEYGAKWAKEDGFPEMAEEMEKHVGISKGIEKIVEPPAPKRSKGWEMEL